ncbi:MAG: hypothetical protein GX783_00535, partial [Clostridiales bacterium]|nr:hypothetical protein [Clostridiales bacterium]
RKPPYCIVINEEIQRDRSVSTARWIENLSLQLDATSTDFIDGKWKTLVKLIIDNRLDALEFEAVGGFGKFGMASLTECTADISMKKTHDYMPLPTPKRGFKSSTEAAKEKANKEFVKTHAQYTSSTQMKATVTGTNTLDGDKNFDLYDPTEDAQTSGDLLALLGIGKSFASECTVDIDVFGDDRATATIKMDGQSYGPFTGKFTTDEEVRWEHKENLKLPIWGVWSGVGPYEAMPKIKNDEKTKNNLDKRIGRWLQLTQGKNKELGENYLGSYQLITATEGQVISETGTLQAYPGTFRCLKVKTLTFNRDDPQNPIEGDGSNHLMNFRYNPTTDTIDGMDIGGKMVRVRNANLIGTWNTIGPVAAMPDPDKVKLSEELPKGVWYRFDKRTEEQKAAEMQELNKNPNGSAHVNVYTYICVDTTGSQGIKKESGTAIFIPMSDEEWIQLADIKGSIYPWDGKEPTQYEGEGNLLMIEGAIIQSGEINLNQELYYRFTPDPLKGSWSSLDGIQPPDPANDMLEAKDSSGKSASLSGNEQWWSFDDKAGSFRHIVYCEEEQGHGYLIETGKYRRTQIDQLLLTEVTGSFYPLSGDGWKDRALPDGDVCYGFNLDVAGNLILHPMEETLYKLAGR